MGVVDHAGLAADLLTAAAEELPASPGRTDAIAAASVHAQLALVGVLERLVGDSGWVER